MSRTMYDEKEREIQHKHLSNFGLNPHALDIIVESYMRSNYPRPVTLPYIVQMEGQGEIEAEFIIRKPGFIGAKAGTWELLDKYGVMMFMRSYVQDVSPYPVDFVYRGLEIHISTRGVFGKKNIAREIFDPTL